jgi:hypothetical protein
LQADFSVELGQEDPALELPWSSGDQSVRYYDLKRFPELVLQIPEAVAHPELSAFLTRMNAPDSPFATAKCDVWPSRDISPEEEIFGAAEKFVSYVDLVFVDTNARISFEKHEGFSEKLCVLLGRVPDIPATVELVIRRCYFHQRYADCQSEVEKSPGLEENSPVFLKNRPEENFSVEKLSLDEVPQTSFSQEGLPLDIMPLESLSPGKAQSGSNPIEGDRSKSISPDSNQSASDHAEIDRTEIDPSESDHAEIDQTVSNPLQNHLHGRPSQNLPSQNLPSQNLPSQNLPSQNLPSRSRPMDDSKESMSGHCLTAYVTGFGDSGHESRRQWAIALALLQHALLQASRR